MKVIGGLPGYDDLPRSVAERKRHADLERLIRWYFPVAEHGMALRVAWTVSGMEPLAYHRNGGMGIGLFDLTTLLACQLFLPLDNERSQPAAPASAAGLVRQELEAPQNRMPL